MTSRNVEFNVVLLSDMDQKTYSDSGTIYILKIERLAWKTLKFLEYVRNALGNAQI